MKDQSKSHQNWCSVWWIRSLLCLLCYETLQTLVIILSIFNKSFLRITIWTSSFWKMITRYHHIVTIQSQPIADSDHPVKRLAYHAQETTHAGPEGCRVTDGHRRDELRNGRLLGAHTGHTWIHSYGQYMYIHTHRSWGEEGHWVMVWAGGAEQSVSTLHWGGQTSFFPISIWQTRHHTDNILQHIFQPAARTIITSTYPWVLGTLSLGEQTDTNSKKSPL